MFNTKNDNREIVIEQAAGMVKVKDQQMWSEAVKKNTTIDGDFRMEPDPFGWAVLSKYLS